MAHRRPPEFRIPEREADLNFAFPLKKKMLCRNPLQKTKFYLPKSLRELLKRICENNLE